MNSDVGILELLKFTSAFIGLIVQGVLLFTFFTFVVPFDPSGCNCNRKNGQKGLCDLHQIVVRTQIWGDAGAYRPEGITQGTFVVTI
jgi:hypothetical protein